MKRKKCTCLLAIIMMLCLSACDVRAGRLSQSEKAESSDSSEEVSDDHPLATSDPDQQEKMGEQGDAGSIDHGLSIQRSKTDKDRQSEKPESGNDSWDMKVRVLEDLGVNGSLLAETYYKAGDCRSTLYFYLSDGNVSSNRLSFRFHRSANDDEQVWEFGQWIEIETVPGQTSYQVTVKNDQELDIGTCLISFHQEDPTKDTPIIILVEGEEGVAGTYYPLNSYDHPELFTRYMSRADLCFYPTENLWLLRNEIYAAHGRGFSNEILSQYFSEKPWYRERVQPSDFSEHDLSDIEKNNILLIQSLEQNENRNQIDSKTYGLEDIPPAPYLFYLTGDREIGLRLDFSSFTDMGPYYSLHGQIFYPVTITQTQLDEVEEGGAAEIVVNELTGEKQVLQLNVRPEKFRYSKYLLSEADDVSDDMRSEASIRPNYRTGLYELWRDSDDTIMKLVYDGEIYLMKGAVSGSYVSLEESSKNQKEIIPEDPDQLREIPGLFQDSLYGNYLSYNERGAITAMYYLGD